MSYTRQALYPCNPGTERGRSTKLAAANVKGSDKIIYANGRSVIVLDLKHPGLSTSFTGHVKETTVARFSPSGFYCASADVSGLVKIWDTVKDDQSVVAEYKVLSGRINDLAWDAASERIIAAGDGREKFAHAFLRNTGASTGEITGHSKVINAVSIRPNRPYRAVTADDDALINFHQGTPFKYVKTIREHTKFVQDVKYAPNGNHFVSVGSDLKIVLYNGEDGDKIADVVDSPHKGSIMACSWSSGSDQFVTSSMDNTVKLWDASTQKNVTTWLFDKGIPNQQVGNTWVNTHEIVSLSMGGELGILDVREGNGRATRVIQAPQKSVTSGTLGASGSDTFFVGTADGRVFRCDTSSAEAEGSVKVQGEGHTSLVSSMTTSASGQVYSAGFDDKLREVDPAAGFTPSALSLGGQPTSLASTADGTLFVIQAEKTGKNTLQAVRHNQTVYTLQPAYKAVSVAASGNVVVVGGEDDNKVHVYTWDGRASTLVEIATSERLGSRGQITMVAVSADGAYIAAGDSVGKIALLDGHTAEKRTDRWTQHTARITSLAFTPGPVPTWLASTSLDTHVYVYSLEAPFSRYEHVAGAAPMGGTVVAWLSGASGIGKADGKGKGRVVSGGADGCVRVWEVILP
ncbi:WD40-repeat-containing domain protein [Boletus reticuloceps]|uniref:WD40-repeat-containing domain protein n=1 Tax=Boletus reticuloceps TaxID=495285 RepID=A0A8I2YSM3_9AGAM|nr:WD40-repeat-containing domain protein [Boletus reticuloceps]